MKPSGPTRCVRPCNCVRLCDNDVVLVRKSASSRCVPRIFQEIPLWKVWLNRHPTTIGKREEFNNKRSYNMSFLSKLMFWKKKPAKTESKAVVSSITTSYASPAYRDPSHEATGPARQVFKNPAIPLQSAQKAPVRSAIQTPKPHTATAPAKTSYSRADDDFSALALFASTCDDTPTRSLSSSSSSSSWGCDSSSSYSSSSSDSSSSCDSSSSSSSSCGCD